MANTYKALQTVSVGAGGAASISFTSIPQTYTDLKIVLSGRTVGYAATQDYANITFNSDTTNSYTMQYLLGDGSSTGAGNSGGASWPGGSVWSEFAADNSTSNTFGNSEFTIFNYASNDIKSINANMTSETNATNVQMFVRAGTWQSTSGVTNITIAPYYGTSFVQYSTFTLYGVFNADVSSAPAIPTIGTASDGGTGDSASITFTGVANAASYTMTSSPGGFTGTGTTSPITVSGLTTGTAYTFTVTASNPFGTSGVSSASNSVTPVPPNYYVMAGTDGGLARSTNLATWTNITTPQPTYNWNGVAKGAGVWAIAGTNGYIYSSTDLSTWTLRLNTGSDFTGDMKFGSSSFVVTGSVKQLYTSTNGTSWTQRTSGFVGNVLIRGTVNNTANSLWIVCGVWDGSSGAQYSYANQSALSSWTTRNIWTAGQSAFKPDANNSVVVVPMSSGDTVRSTDGVTSWSGMSVGFTATGGIAWGNSTWVAVGDSGNVSRSTSASASGGTFTSTTVGSSTFRYVKFVNGNFVIGGNGTPTFYSSTDGVTWTTRSAMSSPTVGNSIAYG
jgi:hypothetical protein